MLYRITESNKNKCGRSGLQNSINPRITRICAKLFSRRFAERTSAPSSLNFWVEPLQIHANFATNSKPKPQFSLLSGKFLTVKNSHTNMCRRNCANTLYMAFPSDGIAFPKVAPANLMTSAINFRKWFRLANPSIYVALLVRFLSISWCLANSRFNFYRRVEFLELLETRDIGLSLWHIE